MLYSRTTLKTYCTIGSSLSLSLSLSLSPSIIHTHTHSYIYTKESSLSWSLFQYFSHFQILFLFFTDSFRILTYSFFFLISPIRFFRSIYLSITHILSFSLSLSLSLSIYIYIYIYILCVCVCVCVCVHLSFKV